jgi:hypothetical protein
MPQKVPLCFQTIQTIFYPEIGRNMNNINQCSYFDRLMILFFETNSRKKNWHNIIRFHLHTECVDAGFKVICARYLKLCFPVNIFHQHAVQIYLDVFVVFLFFFQSLSWLWILYVFLKIWFQLLFCIILEYCRVYLSFLYLTRLYQYWWTNQNRQRPFT